MRKLDLTGRVYGRLTVLEDVGRDKHEHVIWSCLCECGNLTNVLSDSLIRGTTKSCGCFQKEEVTKRLHKNLTGQRFGKWLVLKRVHQNKITRNFFWECLCDCGNKKTVIGSRLVNGCSTSCGCYNLDIHSGENHWNWKGGITPLNHAIRTCSFYINWRTAVFQRDSYTCQHCQQVGENLIAHHLNLFSDIMKENNITTMEEAIQCNALWDIDNGLTLCKKCHQILHFSEGLDNPEEIDYITP